MPFTWRINIKKNPKSGGPAIFEFDQQPTQVQPGDQIFWSNQDTKPHWPSVDGNPTLFMSCQIAPNSSSEAFAPSTAETISYVCSLHPGETGLIVVFPPASEGI